MTTMSWAYICTACDHPASQHGLLKGADLRAGPYRCAHCPCEIAQDAPTYGLSQQQYERYLVAHPEAKAGATT